MNKFQITRTVYSGFLEGINWLFPPECVVCGADNYSICKSCLDKINFIQDPVCQICGAPLRVGTLCKECRRQSPSFDILRSVAFYEGTIRKAIHQLKYQRNFTLGQPLANLLYHKVSALNWSADLVIPVPLSRKRKAQRGFNQAAVLAFWLSLLLECKFAPQGLFRSQETSSQVGLSAYERRQNVENAFIANFEQVKGKQILLVDDVATTGATLNACAKALKIANADKVLAITLAKSHHLVSDLDRTV